jgi:hypothetical protein
LIGAGADGFRAATHFARAVRGRSDFVTFSGDSFNLIVSNPWRDGARAAGARKIRVIIITDVFADLTSRGVRRQHGIRGHDVYCGQSGHAKGDNKVTSFHFHFDITPESEKSREINQLFSRTELERVLGK